MDRTETTQPPAESRRSVGAVHIAVHIEVGKDRDIGGSSLARSVREAPDHNSTLGDMHRPDQSADCPEQGSTLPTVGVDLTFASPSPGRKNPPRAVARTQHALCLMGAEPVRLTGCSTDGHLSIELVHYVDIRFILYL